MVCRLDGVRPLSELILIRPLETNFNEHVIEIQIFSLKNIYSKMSSTVYEVLSISSWPQWVKNGPEQVFYTTPCILCPAKILMYAVSFNKGHTITKLYRIAHRPRGPRFNLKTVIPCMGISIINIRRSWPSYLYNDKSYNTKADHWTKYRVEKDRLKAWHAGNATWIRRSWQWKLYSKLIWSCLGLQFGVSLNNEDDSWNGITN